MTKVTAGVLAGILLGFLHGLYSARGETTAAAVSATLLGRSAQGIINGVLAAYATKGTSSLWKGAIWGVLIGLALGALAALPGHDFAATLPPSALVGLGCGIATAKAKR